MDDLPLPPPPPDITPALAVSTEVLENGDVLQTAQTIATISPDLSTLVAEHSIPNGSYRIEFALQHPINEVLDGTEIHIGLQRSLDGGNIWEEGGAWSVIKKDTETKLTVATYKISTVVLQDGYMYRAYVIVPSQQTFTCNFISHVNSEKQQNEIEKHNSVGYVDSDFATVTSEPPTPISTLTSPTLTVTGTNTYVFAGVCTGNDNATAPATVKWGGVLGSSMTQVGSNQVGTLVFSTVQTVWRYPAASGDANKTVNATWTGSDNYIGTIVVLVTDTTDQSTPVTGIFQAEHSDTITNTFTTVAGQMAIAFGLTVYPSDTTLTLTSSDGTIRQTESVGGIGFAFGVATRSASGTSTSLNLSGDGTQLLYTGFVVQEQPVSNIKTFDGLANASTKTVNGVANASVKTWDGVTNT